MRMHNFCPDNNNANDCSLKLGLSFVTFPSYASSAQSLADGLTIVLSICIVCIPNFTIAFVPRTMAQSFAVSYHTGLSEINTKHGISNFCLVRSIIVCKATIEVAPTCPEAPIGWALIVSSGVSLRSCIVFPYFRK